MGALGERLRRERERHGISLSEISDETHISGRMLQAIEEEAYERLPGGIFNKSFIKQYAEYLGLDEEQAVREYLRSTGGMAETQAQTTSESERRGDTRVPAMARLGLAAVAVIGITLGAWYLHSRSTPSARNAVAIAPANPTTISSAVAQTYTNPMAAQPQTGKAAAAPPATLAQPAGVNTEGEPIPQTSPPAAQPQPSQSAAPPQALLASAGSAATGELLLQINARSTVWLSITADGEKKWQGTMQPNQSREIAAADSIRLTVGNAGGVELTLNGKELGALGGEGEVKTITLAARALAEPAP